MDKLLYTKKPLKPPRRRKESAMYSFARDWECGEKASGREGRRGGLVRYFYGFLFIFFYFLFLILYFQLQRLR